MAGVLQHLRSSTLDKRPNPASMVDGQVAINYASGSPGMFFKDSNGDLVKVGPVHVGSTAPNVSPASGGTAGNSKGEQWLDTSGGTYVFKIWDGAAWRSEAGEFVNSTGDTMTGSLTMGQSADIIFEGSVDDGFETTLTVANPTADRTITLPNVTGTVVTTGDSGSVTSAMIANGTIVDADVNASAAIAGTKISPDFGSQNVVTTGTSTAASFIPTSSSVPTNGVYLPSANNVAISTNGTGRLFVDSSGRVGVGAEPVAQLHSSATLNQFLATDSATNDRLYLSVDNGVAEINTFLSTTSRMPLRFMQYTSEVARFDASGRLGLGTSSPDGLLTVRPASGNAQVFIRTNDTTSRSQLIFGDSADSNTGGIQYNHTTDNLEFHVGNLGEKMTLDATGRLGLGTSSPSTKLSVIGTATGLANGAIRTNTTAGTQSANSGLWLCGNQATTHYNWLIASQYNVGGALEITPSTAVDGATFTTPTAVFTQTGRVGVGTTSPVARFETNVTSDGAESARFRISGLTNNPLMRFVHHESVGTQIDLNGTTGNATQLYVTQVGTERLRIDSSGRLLVGTATNTDNYVFQVDSATNAVAQFTRYTSDAAKVVIGSSRGTQASKTTLNNGDTGGLLEFKGYDGSNFQSLAQIGAQCDGQAPAAGDSPGRLVFSTTADGASSPTERMRITNDGKVGVGTTSPGALFDLAANNDGATGTTANNTFRFTDLDTNTAADQPIGKIEWYSADTSSPGARAVSYILSAAAGANSGGDIRFGVSANAGTASEAVRITSSGQLLVGTSTARANFAGNTATPLVQIEGVTAATASSSVVRGAADATGPTFNLGKTRGASVNQHTAVVSGDQCGVITFQGADGTNLLRAAQIAAEVDNGAAGTALTGSEMPGRLVFSTTADGASSPTPRVQINSSGALQLLSGCPGIDFSAIQTNAAGMTSETLDSYEEGTFTLRIADAASGGNTGTSSTCLYTKVGRVVIVTGSLFTIDTTGLTAGNTVYFQGLPFAPLTHNAVGAITIENITFSGFVTAQCSPSATAFRLAQSSSGSGEAYLNVSALAAGADIVAFQLSYSTAA